MGKLKLLMQISVDGYVGGPEGDLDWRVWNYDNKLKAFANHLRDSSSVILLGRKMAEVFIPHFEQIVNDYQPENGDRLVDEKFAYAKRMVDMSKLVFSKVLKTIDGKNASVGNGNMVTLINNLKREKDMDMIVYGGAGFVSSLIKEGLIDEFNLFVNPVMISRGLRIFDLLERRQKLTLINAVPYPCGIAVLTFKPNHGNEN
ncbi:dihydrofolate reductase family protein [Niabella terrae]